MPETPTAEPIAEHFDPDNRAWQRLGTALADHLDVITWTREDGRPVCSASSTCTAATS